MQYEKRGQPETEPFGTPIFRVGRCFINDEYHHKCFLHGMWKYMAFMT